MDNSQLSYMGLL